MTDPTDAERIASLKSRAAELYASGRPGQAHFLTMIAFEIEHGGAPWLQIMREHNIQIGGKSDA